MEQREPPINEIIGFLDKHAPRALEDLRRKFTKPEQLELLKPGLKAGKVDKQLQLKAEASITGLRASIELCENNIGKVRQRIKRANLVQFISQIMTAISGASIFAALQLDAPKTGKYLAAAFALLGTVLALSGRHIGATLNPDGDLLNMYNELIECKIEAQQIKRELEPWVLSGFRGDSKTDFIAKTNTFFVRIERVMSAA